MEVIVWKIKNFFRNLFCKKNNDTVEKNINTQKTIENNKNSFRESLKNIENEEIELLKLQKRYRNGEIKEEDLTNEQINLLSELYDKQIANLKKSNEARKQKNLQYHIKMQNN